MKNQNLSELFVVNHPASDNHGELVVVLETKKGKTKDYSLCQKRSGQTFYVKENWLNPAEVSDIINNLTVKEVIGSGLQKVLVNHVFRKCIRNFKFLLEEGDI